MAIAIRGILSESREYYRKLKRELVGRLLINTRGSLHQKKAAGKVYVHIRRMAAGVRSEHYLGTSNDAFVKGVDRSIAISRTALADLRQAKAAMKELHMQSEEIISQDYMPLLRDIFQVFEGKGLWDSGLELIGSWCFKIYQNYCDVEFYPERTIDIDFAVRLPYSGKAVNIGDALKAIGFTEEINAADGSIRYVGGSLLVEFLKVRKGDGQARGGDKSYEPDLGLAPVAIPYLGILLDNPMTLKLRDLGRVVVPSMPAFMLHKLIVADERRQPDKRAKDFRQAEAVAKAILADAMVADVARIAGAMHKKWRGKLVKSARQLSETQPSSGAVLGVLERAGLL